MSEYEQVGESSMYVQGVHIAHKMYPIDHKIFRHGSMNHKANKLK